MNAWTLTSSARTHACVCSEWRCARAVLRAPCAEVIDFIKLEDAMRKGIIQRQEDKDGEGARGQTDGQTADRCIETERDIDSERQTSRPRQGR